MAKKEISRNPGLKAQKSENKKLATQKAQELMTWKKNNLTQKRFFSLEEKEQHLVEKIYLIFVQVCPDLSWEDYLDRLRKSDNHDAITKTIAKKIIRS
jgi:hypothetical protein